MIPKTRSKSLWLAVILGVIAIPVLAQEEEPKTIKLREITVTAARTEILQGLDSSITVLNVDRFHEGNTMSVEALLDGIPGVDLTRQSLGGNTGGSVRIRGFNESQFTVLVDGRPVNAPGVYGGDYVDWSMLTLSDIERVEVIRGPKAARYGNTLGGVINIITKKPQEDLDLRVKSTYGSYDSFKAMARSSYRYGAFGYSVSGGYRETDGFLRNNYQEGYDFNAQGYLFLLGDGYIAPGVRLGRLEKGFAVPNLRHESWDYDSNYPDSAGDIFSAPGSFDNDTHLGDDSYWDKDIYRYYVDLYLPIKQDLSLRGSYTFNKEDRHEHVYTNFSGTTVSWDPTIPPSDPWSPPGGPSFYTWSKGELVVERDSELDRSHAWNLEAEYELSHDHTIRVGHDGQWLTYGDTTYDYANLNAWSYMDPYFVADSTEKHPVSKDYAGFIEYVGRVLPSLRAYAGLRYDHFKFDPKEQPNSEEFSDDYIVPKLGLAKYLLDEMLEVHLAFAQAKRHPTQPEVYWYFNGYDFAEKPDLSLEYAKQFWELGASVRPDEGLLLGANAYYYEVHDYIQFLFGEAWGGGVVYNIDKVKLYGVELEARFPLPFGLKGYANYTFQKTKKEGDPLDLDSYLTDELTEIPEHKAYVEIEYVPYEDAAIGLNFRIVGDRDTIQGDPSIPGGARLEKLGSFIVTDLYVDLPLWGTIGEKVSFIGQVNNLFDVDYEERYQVLMPDINVMVGLQARF
jgi:outer membrane receptor protein involved in Fe transport